MNRANSLRTAAKILHKSLQNTEQSPDIDSVELPFVKLESSVLDAEVKERAAAIETPTPEETTDQLIRPASMARRKRIGAIRICRNIGIDQGEHRCDTIRTVK